MFQDVTVLYEGAEITRGSLSQVLEVLTTASPTTRAGAAENSRELSSTADVDGELPGPAGVSISAQGEWERLNNSESDVDESMRKNKALWAVYFKK